MSAAMLPLCIVCMLSLRLSALSVHVCCFSFFTILSGKVSIYITNKEDDEEEPEEEPEEEREFRAGSAASPTACPKDQEVSSKIHTYST